MQCLLRMNILCTHHMNKISIFHHRSMRCLKYFVNSFFCLHSLSLVLMLYNTVEQRCIFFPSSSLTPFIHTNFSFFSILPCFTSLSFFLLLLFFLNYVFNYVKHFSVHKNWSGGILDGSKIYDKYGTNKVIVAGCHILIIMLAILRVSSDKI